MREFTAEERRRRLISRQFLSLTDSIIHATAGLVGLHATDPATPFLSLWARCPRFVAADLEAELYQSRSVVRHLAMRRTLWVVSADDLPIIQSAASNRVAANEHRRLVADVKWWFGTTLTAARKALSDIGAVEVVLGSGAGYVLPDDLEIEPEVAPSAALLPGLDVTTMGWLDRDWYLGEHRGQVFDRNGNAGPTAWWNGHVVGGWYQDHEAHVQVQLLEDPGRDGRRALQRRATELTSWLDGVRINPRFPSLLSKSGT